jgi:hypothetical protein
LFEKCTMACPAIFCKNHSTSIVSNLIFFFWFFIPIISWIFQSHWFIWSLIFKTFPSIICFFF